MQKADSVRIINGCSHSTSGSGNSFLKSSTSSSFSIYSNSELQFSVSSRELHKRTPVSNCGWSLSPTWTNIFPSELIKFKASDRGWKSTASSYTSGSMRNKNTILILWTSRVGQVTVGLRYNIFRYKTSCFYLLAGSPEQRLGASLPSKVPAASPF